MSFESIKAHLSCLKFIFVKYTCNYMYRGSRGQRPLHRVDKTLDSPHILPPKPGTYMTKHGKIVGKMSVHT